MKSTTRIQLSAMMFLEFFIWGGWFVTLGTFLLTSLETTGTQVGMAYLTQSIGAIIAPFIVGIIADRFFSAQVILGVLHLVGAVLLWMAGAVLVKYNNGASGVLFATQVAAGEENNVRVRVYGEKGGVEWKQEDANTLLVKWLDRPVEVWRAGTGYLSELASQNCRTPAGHPEGYLEAFANHYRNFARCLKAKLAGVEPKKEWLDFPGVQDGVRGMAFITNVIRSGKSSEKWMPFEM